MRVVDEYFNIHNKYSKEHGNDSTLVLYQKGDFYEIYGIDETNTTPRKGPNMERISVILDHTVTCTDKSKPISDTNPRMIGFPIRKHSLLSKLEKLKEEAYTVIIVDEEKDASGKIKRVVKHVISIGTDLESLHDDSTYLGCIYIKYWNKDKVSIGMSVVDVTTGRSIVYEVESLDTSTDNNYPFDELYRFLQTFNPKEIVCHVMYNKNIKGLKNEDIETKLSEYLIGKSTLHINELKSNYVNINYKNEFLAKCYPESNEVEMSAIEFLDLEMKPIACTSFVILLQYANSHNPLTIYRLTKPEILTKNDKLILDYNTVNQLDLIENRVLKKQKFNSVFDVINNTCTSMGKRQLKHLFLNPISSIEELNRSYDMVETVLSMSVEDVTQLKKYLSSIMDLERLQRKLFLKKIVHIDLYSFYNVYTTIYMILDRYSEYFEDKEGLKNDIKIFCDKFEKIFDLDKLQSYGAGNGSDSMDSFFNEGIDVNIDALNGRVKTIYKNIEELKERYQKLIPVSKRVVKDAITIVSEQEGIYFKMTKKRFDVLKKALSEREASGIIQCRSTKQDIKITTNGLNDMVNELLTCKVELETLLNKSYLEILEYFEDEFAEIFNDALKFIIELDVSYSNAMTARKYNYVRPTIVLEGENRSYVKMKGMRHPLIERLMSDELYVPMDVSLGTEDQQGILLYGINAVGKSSCMKGIGINVIMAQSGMFVPCESMEISLFTKLMTRITGTDDLLRGKSSFVVEMTELRSIINRSDKNTLVLGDEICRGTEQTSGVAIIASTVEYLLKENDTNFIFATHAHSLNKLKEIQELVNGENGNLKQYHMKVSREDDGEGGFTLVYHRTLHEGCGDSIYGLMVTEAIGFPDKFISKAGSILREIKGESEEIHSSKRSRYNKDVFMDKCALCKKEKSEDTHHLNPQSEADCWRMIGHVQRDHKANLAPLCKKCHIEVHMKGRKLKWLKTSKGYRLKDV